MHHTINSTFEQVKGKTSQFEKDTIKKDLVILNANWIQFKEMINPLEKSAIHKHWAMMKALLNKILNLRK